MQDFFCYDLQVLADLNGSVFFFSNICSINNNPLQLFAIFYCLPFYCQILNLSAYEKMYVCMDAVFTFHADDRF